MDHTTTLPQHRFDIELNEKIQFKQPWFDYRILQNCFCVVVTFCRKVGLEYTKQLKIKNVGKDIINIKYILPTQKNIFLLPLPVDFKLSTGMSKTIEVKFVPKEMKNYEDTVEFKTTRGSIFVPLYALLPSTVVVFDQKELDFGPIATKETSEATITVRNMGEQTISLLTQVLAPFSVFPSKVDLTPSSKTELRFSVYCTEAGFFRSTAICTVTDKKGIVFSKQALELNANAKYSFITIDKNLLEFFDVELGTASTKSFTIHNKSSVKTGFSIQGTRSSSFFVTPSEGLLLPNSSQDIVVSYKPIMAGNLQITDFLIISSGGKKLSITASGMGSAPTIFLKQTLLDFGNVRIGTFIRKSLDIVNTSQIPVHFVLDNEDKWINFHPRAAIIPPNSSISVVATFSPLSPVPFFKRIFVKFSQHNFVPFVDILGSGYNDTNQPYVLNPSYISLYNKSQFSESITPESIMKWYFESSWPNQTQHSVSIDKTYLGFGSIAKLKSIEYQIVKIQNNSRKPITCFAYANNSDSKTNFIVLPERCDIAPGTISDFKIGVKPLQGEVFFSSTVEFLSVDSRLLNYNAIVEEVVLPTLQSVHVNGNTFSEVSNVAAKFKFTPNFIEFNDCITGDIRYQCAILENDSDVSMPFNFEIGSLYPVFQCRPSAGCVKPKSVELIHFLFLPDKAEVFTAEGRCILNHSIVSSFNFGLKGNAILPSLNIEGEGKLFAKPTYVGLSNDKNFEIYNPTNVDLIAELKVANAHKHLIKIIQPRFSIKARERIIKTLVFSPLENIKYMISISCKVYFDSYSRVKISGLDYVDQNTKHSNHIGAKCDSTIALIGDGVSGGVRVSSYQLNFGHILVGTTSKLSLTIFNDNSCPVFIRIVSLERSTNGLVSSKIFSTSVTQVTLTERSQNRIEVLFSPVCEALNECEVYLILPSVLTDLSMLELPNVESYVASGKCIRVTLSGNGAFPHLGITDAWCEKFSKSDLWSFFSLDSLNAECQKSINTSIAIKYDVLFDEMVKGFSRVSFNFGSREVDSNATQVFLNFENVGHVPLDFEFEFPRDFLASLDKWADIRFLETEFHRRREHILQNKLFSIEPQKGKLFPKQHLTMKFSYAHSLVDSHSIPVLFKVFNGVCCVMDLKGRTFSLETNNKELEFKSFEFELAPVDIGLSSSPLQYIALRNPCRVSVQYVVDISPLQELKKENYDMEILTLENSYGNIEPNSFTLLRFSFNPIEAKEYEVELPIRLIDGANYSITLRGKGVVKQLPKEELRESNLEILTPKLPIVQKMSALPSQLISVSLCNIHVGKMPCLSTMKRLLVIRNVSKTDVVSFMFNSQLPTHSKLATSSIHFEPATAILKPQEYSVCLLEIVTGRVSQIIDSDIVIAVTNETEKAEREKIRKEYEKKLISKQSVVTIEKKAMRNSVVTGNTLQKTQERPNSPSDFWKQSDYYNKVTNYTPTNYFVKLKGEVVDVECFKKLSAEEPTQYNWSSFYFKLIREYEAKMHLDDFKSITKANSHNALSTVKQTIKQVEMNKELVQDVCMELLQDLLYDQEIGSAWNGEHNKDRRVPYFMELIETPRSIDNVSITEEEDTIQQVSTEHVQQVYKEVEQQKMRQYEQLTSANNQQEQQSSSNQEPILTKEDVMKSVEFQNVTESILESICYELCKEALRNEWAVVGQA